MKKLVFILVIILFMVFNAKAEILSPDFDDLKAYDMFILKINNNLTDESILKYFSGSEILSVIPHIDIMYQDKVSIIYNGDLSKLKRYYVDKIDDLNLLINTSYYNYEPINLEYIKVYTSYGKVLNLLKDYPDTLYNNTINKKLRKYV